MSIQVQQGRSFVCLCSDRQIFSKQWEEPSGSQKDPVRPRALYTRRFPSSCVTCWCRSLLLVNQVLHVLFSQHAPVLELGAPNTRLSGREEGWVSGRSCCAEPGSPPFIQSPFHGVTLFLMPIPPTDSTLHKGFAGTQCVTAG